MSTACPALSRLNHPAVDAVMSTAAALLGMEIVFIGGITEDSFSLERIRGTIPGVSEGDTLGRADTFCHRLLGGASASTADAASDPEYRDAPAREQFGICSYVGVPIRDGSGRVVATLCGIDRGSVPVDAATIGVLSELALVIAAHLGDGPTDAVMIRRTPVGWQVAESPADDLTSAMVLADMLAGELSPPARPARPQAPLDEVGRLRLSVHQLEHALAARVAVEQAIGVLSERQRSTPRDAFERLRKVARSRGRRVHDLAREVVGSAADPATPLPPELAGRR